MTHKMKHGDYILREDIPDEATFRRVCEVAESQDVPLFRSGCKTLAEADQNSMGWDAVQVYGGILVWTKRQNRNNNVRITPADLGITTQEADMTPCEKIGLRKGWWVWRFHDGNLTKGWVQLHLDDGSVAPVFFDPRQYRMGYGLLKYIDWRAGIHNEKPETEYSMSETLTEAEALREVADAIERGDKSPWQSVQFWSEPFGRWEEAEGPGSFGMSVREDALMRRKPRTVRIEGEISEWALNKLKELRGIPSVEDDGHDFDAMADEFLSAVQGR